MRPQSIVSLIVAVLLVIVGLVTCMIAQNMAQANGEYLFSEIRGEDNVQTVDLTDSEISKIELIVEDAEINIYGKSEKSYIEFINFKENYYSLSATNRILSFDEIPDLMSMLKFWENGFSFKGMRYLINFSDMNTEETEERQKVINVYLTKDKLIKIFDIKAKTGTITIKDMVTETDYNIVTEDATVNASTLKTSSALTINEGEDIKPAKNLTLNLTTAFINNLNVNADNLQMTANLFRCSGNGEIICSTGSVSIGSVTDTRSMNLEIKTAGGFVHIDGETVSPPYNHIGSESNPGKLSINTVTANVSVRSVTQTSEDLPAEE